MSSLYEQLDKFNYNNDINNFCLSDRVDMLRVKKKTFDLTKDRYLKKEKIQEKYFKKKKNNLPQYNYYKIDLSQN